MLGRREGVSRGAGRRRLGRRFARAPGRGILPGRRYRARKLVPLCKGEAPHDRISLTRRRWREHPCRRCGPVLVDRALGPSLARSGRSVLDSPALRAHAHALPQLVDAPSGPVVTGHLLEFLPIGAITGSDLQSECRHPSWQPMAASDRRRSLRRATQKVPPPARTARSIAVMRIPYRAWGRKCVRAVSPSGT